MLQFIVKRLLGLIPTLLIVGLLVFLFVHLLPGDPARLAAGVDATPETVALVRQDLGLDKSLPQQFLRFATGVLHGDFGKPLRTKRPVSEEIGDRFMPTLWLTIAAMSWSVVIGMIIGVLSAVWRNRWPDRLGMTLAVSGHLVPRVCVGDGAHGDLRGAAQLAAYRGRGHLEALHPAVVDAWRRGRRDHGEIHPLVVRRHPAGRLRAYRACQGFE
jgi:ABC-type microcin C transport system permease subunit YejB